MKRQSPSSSLAELRQHRGRAIGLRGLFDLGFDRWSLRNLLRTKRVRFLQTHYKEGGRATSGHFPSTEEARNVNSNMSSLAARSPWRVGDGSRSLSYRVRTASRDQDGFLPRSLSRRKLSGRFTRHLAKPTMPMHMSQQIM